MNKAKVLLFLLAYFLALPLTTEASTTKKRQKRYSTIPLLEAIIKQDKQQFLRLLSEKLFKFNQKAQIKIKNQVTQTTPLNLVLTYNYNYPEKKLTPSDQFFFACELVAAGERPSMPVYRKTRSCLHLAASMRHSPEILHLLLFKAPFQPKLKVNNLIQHAQKSLSIVLESVKRGGFWYNDKKLKSDGEKTAASQALQQECFKKILMLERYRYTHPHIINKKIFPIGQKMIGTTPLKDMLFLFN